MKQEVIVSESYAKNKDKYKSYAHSVGVSMFHLEWCTKYRYKIFRKLKYRNMIAACIRQSAVKNGIKLLELEVEPEHVHCIVEFDFSKSLSQVFQFLKGGSSRKFFQIAEKMKLRYPRGNLWSKGKFAASVGFIQVDVARDYVRNQAKHHETIFLI